MNLKKILIILHSDLIPPKNIKSNQIDRFKCPFITEYDIITTLKKIGHVIKVVGLSIDLNVLENAIIQFKPDLIFNVLEEFQGSRELMPAILDYCSFKKIAYTGSNTKSIRITQDKSLAKSLLVSKNILTPKYQVFLKGQKVRPLNPLSCELKYPLIVKCLNEEASLGISFSSIVNTPTKLKERIAFIHHNKNDDCIVEEYIDGREFFVAMLGFKKKIISFAPIELVFGKNLAVNQRIYTENAKFNKHKRSQMGLELNALLPQDLLYKSLNKTCAQIYKDLNLRGTVRMEFRVTKDQKIYFLEANANPDLALDAEYFLGAKAIGMSYEEFIQNIVEASIR